MQTKRLLANQDIVLDLYYSSDEPVKKIFEKMFGKEVLAHPISSASTEDEKLKIVIRSYEDACDFLGIKTYHSCRVAINGLNASDNTSVEAYAKLIIIARALNGLWEPDWSNPKQKKWAPKFKLKGGRMVYNISGRWHTDKCTDVGSRLVYETRELAVYAAMQFAELYNQFINIR